MSDRGFKVSLTDDWRYIIYTGLSSTDFFPPELEKEKKAMNVNSYITSPIEMLASRRQLEILIQGFHD